MLEKTLTADLYLETNFMKGYVAEFKAKIAEFDKDAQIVNIVNAGNMNHDQSSLLNAFSHDNYFVEHEKFAKNILAEIKKLRSALIALKF